MTNNPLNHALFALGLSEHEAAIYIFLAHEGVSNISSIAKGVHLSRVTTYTYIEKLLEKNLLLKTKHKERDLYEVCDPSSLIASLDEVHKEGSRALTSLSQALKKTLFIPKITIHTGRKELLDVYVNIAKDSPRGGTFFRYTSRTDDFGFAPLYTGLREEKELERLVITSEHKAERTKKDSNRFIKTVPKDFSFDDNVTLIIHGNKVTHIDYSSLTGVTIESPQLARFQEKIFKLLWKKL
jgi:predicted transcriptional regulator